MWQNPAKFDRLSGCKPFIPLVAATLLMLCAAQYFRRNFASKFRAARENKTARFALRSGPLKLR